MQLYAFASCHKGVRICGNAMIKTTNKRVEEIT